MSTRNLLMPSEAAEVLQLTTARVTRLARRGEIPAIYLPGGDIRFDVDALYAWIDSRRTPQVEDALAEQAREGQS